MIMVKIATNKGLIKEFRVCLWWPGSGAIQISFSRIFHEGLLTGSFRLPSLWLHCVHAEVMPSPCCPPPPLIDGCIRVRPFSNMSTVWRATSVRGWPSISLGKAFSGPWFSAWPTLPPRLPSQMSHLHHPTCPFLLPLPLSFTEISPYVFLVQLIFSWPLGGPELTEHPPTKY